MKTLTLIAAVSKNNAIGRGGAIPWHCSEDFAHFKRETLGQTLLMGRGTWDSIGVALPRRHTIVLTHNHDWSGPEAVDVCHGLSEALQRAEETMGEHVMVCGGASIYEEALPLASLQILTRMPLIVKDADAYYPRYNDSAWKMKKQISLTSSIVVDYLESHDSPHIA